MLSKLGVSSYFLSPDTWLQQFIASLQSNAWSEISHSDIYKTKDITALPASANLSLLESTLQSATHVTPEFFIWRQHLTPTDSLLAYIATLAELADRTQRSANHLLLIVTC